VNQKGYNCVKFHTQRICVVKLIIYELNNEDYWFIIGEIFK